MPLCFYMGAFTSPMTVLSPILSKVKSSRIYALPGDKITIYGGDGGHVLFCRNERTGERFPATKEKLDAAAKPQSNNKK